MYVVMFTNQSDL